MVQKYLSSDSGLVAVSIVLMLLLGLPVLIVMAHARHNGSFWRRLWHVSLFGWYLSFTMLDAVTSAIWTTRFLADAATQFCVQAGAAGSAPLDMRRNADRDVFVGALAICFLVVGTSFTFWYSCHTWVRLCVSRGQDSELYGYDSDPVTALMGSAMCAPCASMTVALGVTGTLAWLGSVAYSEPRRFAGCDSTSESTDWLTWLPQMLMAAAVLSALLATITLFRHGIAYDASSAHPEPPRCTADVHAGMVKAIFAPFAWLRICGCSDRRQQRSGPFVPLFIATLLFFCTWPLALAYVLVAVTGYFAVMLSTAAMLSTGEAAMEIMTHLGIAEPATSDSGTRTLCGRADVPNATFSFPVAIRDTCPTWCRQLGCTAILLFPGVLTCALLCRLRRAAAQARAHSLQAAARLDPHRCAAVVDAPAVWHVLEQCAAAAQYF